MRSPLVFVRYSSIVKGDDLTKGVINVQKGMKQKSYKLKTILTCSEVIIDQVVAVGVNNGKHQADVNFLF